MSGADTSQKTGGCVVVPGSPWAYGRRQIKGVYSFLFETRPYLHGDVFARTSAFQLLLVVGRDWGEGNAVGSEDLKAVEDRRCKGPANGVFIGCVKRLHKLRVEDGLGDEELGASSRLCMGEAGLGFNVGGQIDGSSDAKVGCAFQGPTTTVKPPVHASNNPHQFRGPHSADGTSLTAVVSGEGITSENEHVFQSKSGGAQEVALKGEGVHVTRGDGEEYLVASVLVDSVGGHGGVGAGNSARVVVDGDEVSVEVSGVFEEVEGPATGRGEIADDKGVTSS